jgi:hypothetical protein
MTDIKPAPGPTLSTEQIKAILAYACKDSTRFHLGGVFLDGTHLVATDGHRLVAVPWRYTCAAYTGPESGLIVPAADLALACKTAGARGTVEIRVLDGGPKIALVARTRADKYGAPGPEARFQTAAIDATYPPYERAIPRGDTLASVALDPAYLADVSLIASAFAEDPDRHREPSVEIAACGGRLDPIIFRAGYARDVRIVVMPMRAAHYSTETQEGAAQAA